MSYDSFSVKAQVAIQFAIIIFYYLSVSAVFWFASAFSFAVVRDTLLKISVTVCGGLPIGIKNSAKKHKKFAFFY